MTLLSSLELWEEMDLKQMWKHHTWIKPTGSIELLQL